MYFFPLMCFSIYTHTYDSTQLYICRLIICNRKVIWYLYTYSSFFIKIILKLLHNLQPSPSCANISVPHWPLWYVLWWYPNSVLPLCINYPSFFFSNSVPEYEVMPMKLNTCQAFVHVFVPLLWLTRQIYLLIWSGSYPYVCIQ